MHAVVCCYLCWCNIICFLHFYDMFTYIQTDFLSGTTRVLKMKAVNKPIPPMKTRKRASWDLLYVFHMNQNLNLLLVKPLSHQGGVLTATARRARKTQNAEVRAVRYPIAPRDRRGIAAASPLDAVGSHRTPCHGANFVHAQSARRGSAFPRRSEWAPC